LLQEIDAQHPLDADRRTAIARIGIEGLISPHSACRGTTRSISAKNAARANFGKALQKTICA
jgi:hypothetical protein